MRTMTTYSKGAPSYNAISTTTSEAPVTCQVNTASRVGTYERERPLFVHFLGCSDLLAFSACPRCAQSLCCSGVI